MKVILWSCLVAIGAVQCRARYKSTPTKRQQNDEVLKNDEATFWQNFVFGYGMSRPPEAHDMMSFDPSLSPTDRPTAFPTLLPTKRPSLSPTATSAPTQECTGEVQEFTTTLLFDLEIPPTYLTAEQPDLVLDILQTVYQTATACDTPGAFVIVTEARVNMQATDANGDFLEPMPWIIELDITCRGCRGVAFADDASSSSSNQEEQLECNCDLPLVDDYVDSCNQALRDNPILGVSSPRGSTKNIGIEAVFGAASILGSTGNSLAPFTFDTVVRLRVSCPSECSSYNWSPVARAMLQVYNGANANNPNICDPDGRVVSAVNFRNIFPEDEAEVDDEPPFAFTVVFILTATCRGTGCNSQAVLFGNHQRNRQRRLLDVSLLCPETEDLVVGCPQQRSSCNALITW